MLNRKLKFDFRRPKAFNIKETDSIEKIDKMQRELKNTIKKLQDLYDGIEKFRSEKAFNKAFGEKNKKQLELLKQKLKAFNEVFKK